MEEWWCFVILGYSEHNYLLQSIDVSSGWGRSLLARMPSNMRCQGITHPYILFGMWLSILLVPRTISFDFIRSSAPSIMTGSEAGVDSLQYRVRSGSGNPATCDNYSRGWVVVGRRQGSGRVFPTTCSHLSRLPPRENIVTGYGDDTHHL